METFQLVPHPAHPPQAIRAMEAKVIGRDRSWLRLRWRLDGSGRINVPPFAGKGRADGLWRTTCFELFLQPLGGNAYCEFNMSPSERWNAYDFAGWREGMQERPMPREPECTMRQGSSFAIFDVAIPVAGLPRAECAMSMTAVIEEEGGTLSYWAMGHGSDMPDFHAPACFGATLAAPAD